MGVAIELVSKDPAVRAAASRAFTAAPAGWSISLLETPSGTADVVVDETGEGGSVCFDRARPGDALAEVERLLAHRRSAGSAVLVAGAGGGVGTTTLALHLAGSWGPGTCYADLAGGAARRLGLPADARTWLPAGDDCPEAALPVAGGYRVLCAPVPCPPPSQFPLASARSSFERLVLDAGTGRGLDPLLDAVRVGILVTTPTRPGAESARAVVEAFPSTRWAVVTNRVGPGGQIMRRGLEAILGRRLTLELPCCPALRDAEDEGRLLTGAWHRWTRAVGRLARVVDAC